MSDMHEYIIKNYNEFGSECKAENEVNVKKVKCTQQIIWIYFQE